MAETNSSAGLWIAGLVGLVAVGTWLVSSRTQDAPRRGLVEVTAPAAMPTSPTPASPPEVVINVAEVGIPRISEHGRLTIDFASLPKEGPLSLDLEVPDESHGGGKTLVKVISTDGRRTDTTASPLPGAGSGVRVEIDPSYLTPGRYMIEIKTEDKQPLQLRRYVLEIR